MDLINSDQEVPEELELKHETRQGPQNLGSTQMADPYAQIYPSFRQMQMWKHCLNQSEQESPGLNVVRHSKTINLHRHLTQT
jgi:hypothetical protein